MCRTPKLGVSSALVLEERCDSTAYHEGSREVSSLKAVPRRSKYESTLSGGVGNNRLAGDYMWVNSSQLCWQSNRKFLCNHGFDSGPSGRSLF